MKSVVLFFFFKTKYWRFKKRMRLKKEKKTTELRE